MEYKDKGVVFSLHMYTYTHVYLEAYIYADIHPYTYMLIHTYLSLSMLYINTQIYAYLHYTFTLLIKKQYLGMCSEHCTMRRRLHLSDCLPSGTWGAISGIK